MRFLGFPENESAEKNSSEGLYRFMERELEIDGALDIELQRVNRIGRKRVGVSRPIIEWFLKYHPNRDRVFMRALEAKDELEARGDPSSIAQSKSKYMPFCRRRF